MMEFVAKRIISVTSDASLHATISFLMSDSQISELQKIQNRFMRLILKMPFRTHIKDMIEMLQ
jgi:hypothetical protein